MVKRKEEPEDQIAETSEPTPSTVDDETGHMQVNRNLLFTAPARTETKATPDTRAASSDSNPLCDVCGAFRDENHAHAHKLSDE